MIRHTSHSSRPVEPLPDTFELDLIELDERLESVLNAQAAQVPAYLCDRVYAASVVDLPASRELQPLRFRPAAARLARPRSNRVWHQLAWGRLAMAACLMIVAAAAFSFMQQQRQPGSGGLALDDAAFGIPTNMLAANINFAPIGSSSEAENRVAHLLVTQDITLDDLHHDTVRLVASLDMY